MYLNKRRYEMGEKLNVIIKDSAYKLTQFTQKSIDELEDKVFFS